MTVLKSVKEKVLIFFKEVKQVIVKPKPTYKENIVGIGVSNM